MLTDLFTDGDLPKKSRLKRSSLGGWRLDTLFVSAGPLKSQDDGRPLVIGRLTPGPVPPEYASLYDPVLGSKETRRPRVLVTPTGRT